MMFTHEQMRQARRSDLYAFLVKNHACLFDREYDSLRPKDNHSISVKRGYSGYTDFSTDETGNAVDFLTKYLGYSISEAVIALCGGPDDHNVNLQPTEPSIPELPLRSGSEESLALPPPVNGRYRQLFAYLTKKRGLPVRIIQHLIDEGLLYQEAKHNNLVFINHEQDYAELHGTLSYGTTFHGCLKASPDRFWWFRTSRIADTAYLCEAAIDAISLYLILNQDGGPCDAYYISLGGVANFKTVERIRRQGFLKRVILAVDNDKAGQICRDRFPELDAVIPHAKDWNEDWLNICNT